MSREHIAAILKQLRMKKGYTIFQVGEMIGKSGKTVSAWENNHGQPDAEMLIKLCEIYEVDDILNEFREEPKQTTSALEPTEIELLSIYNELDSMDKGIIIGEMKQMLRQEKYHQIKTDKMA